MRFTNGMILGRIAGNAEPRRVVTLSDQGT
jgi:hypothetical protein